MNGMKIPLCEPCITRREIDAVTACMEQGAIASDPANLERAKAALRALLRGHPSLLTTSCTAALEMAFQCLDLQPGDEVILPSFTFVSCSNAVLRSGGIPRFAEIEDRTLTLDLGRLEEQITPRTRAVIPVHYAGISCDMDELLGICKKHGIAVVEDAAHAIGARYKNIPLGTLGTFGCFSFHHTKNVVCGEGGALTINDPSYRERAEIIYEKGTNRGAFLRGEVDKYTWVDQGGSYIISAILASLLAVQLERAEEMNAQRGAVMEIYKRTLLPLQEAGHIRFTDIPAYATPNHHLAFFLVEDPAVRDSLLSYLRGWGIQATFHYIPLHSSPYAQKRWGYAADDLPVTERVAKSIVRLPLFPHLAHSDAEFIADIVKKFFTGGEVIRSEAERPRVNGAQTQEELDLSLILPCYHEEGHLHQSLRHILQVLDRSKMSYEIILIDDCSTDGTPERIREFLSAHPRHRLRAVFHEKNRGRGATVVEGIRMAKGRNVGFIDIDLEVQARYIPAFLLPLQQGEADVVVADRYYHKHVKFFHRVAMSVLYRWLVQWILQTPSMDTEAGYKFFRRAAILPVLGETEDERWFWDTEVMVRSFDTGLRIVSIPVLFEKKREKKSTVRYIPDSMRSLQRLLQFRSKRQRGTKTRGRRAASP